MKPIFQPDQAERWNQVERWLPPISLLAFLLPLLGAYWVFGGMGSLLSDPNTGVHVRAGQWILAHRTVPRRDIFSFTLPGRAWCDWEWLSDVIYAAIHRVWGLAGVAALSLALLCLVSLIVYWTARMYSNRAAAFATALVVMGATTIHWLARPHVFSWLFVAVFCLVVERTRRSGKKRALFVLPVLTGLWVQLHPGFLAGIGLLGVWCLGEVARSLISKDSEQRREGLRWAGWFGLTAAGCLAVSVVNPYGFELLRHIGGYLFAPTTVTAHVAEWLSPDFRNPRLSWFELLIPLGAAAGLWHGMRQRFAWCGMTLLALHFALVSVRNVPIFAILSAAPVASLLDNIFRRFVPLRHIQASHQANGLARRAAEAVVAYGVVAGLLVGTSVRPRPRMAEENQLPVAASRRLPSGRLFTTDQWADYLIYTEPERRVFFDGRSDFYGPAFVRDYLTVMGGRPGWQTVLERYDLKVAMVPRRSSIAALLDESPSWTRRYQDSTAVIFVRRGPVARRMGKDCAVAN
ncbi:MAG: hypothetical protein ACYDD2_14340 [Candidatus Acidiferrales bacterium]